MKRERECCGNKDGRRIILGCLTVAGENSGVEGASVLLLNKCQVQGGVPDTCGDTSALVDFDHSSLQKNIRGVTNLLH